MALKVTDIGELKYYRVQLSRSYESYDYVIKNILDSIKDSALYWQGEDGEVFRERLYSLVSHDLNCISKEIKAEADYLGKIITVLENAQEQVKNRLNG